MRAIRFALAVPVAAIAALAWLPASAAQSLPAEETVTWYDVEMIVFRNLETRSTEKWPPDAGVPDVENAKPLFPPAEARIDPETGEPLAEKDIAEAQPLEPRTEEREDAGAPTPYEPLGEAAYQLAGVVSSLERSSLYEPILHVVWTQPPLERRQAPRMRITLPGALDPEVPEQEPRFEDEWRESFDAQPEDEPMFPQAGEPATADGDERAPVEPSFSTEDLPEGAEAFLAEEQEPEFARPLDGFAQLSVSRYLHMDLDLLYLPEDLNTAVLDDIPAATREWTEEDRRAREQRQRNIVEALARGDITLEEAEILSLEPEQQVFEGFRLNQYRRLRSRELHYFDHPVFGVIVMVTPREVSARTMETGATGTR